jgi:hypothetical protein
MKIKGVSEQAINNAAQSLGFRLDNVRQKGNYTLFVLRMATRTPSPKERREFPNHPFLRYRKHGHCREYTFAVCFHGHKEFMDKIFEINPCAVIRTCKAVYLGQTDFANKYDNVGHSNAGSMMNPIQYMDMCDCD